MSKADKEKTVSLSRRTLIGAACALPALSASLTLAPAALAQEGLNAEQRRLLTQAETYLRSMTQARGRFVETGPRGQRTNGAFYLRRPGRMRFEYDAPSRLVVTSDGTWIHRADPRLETYNRVPLNQTPLEILIGRTVSFNDRYIRVNRVTAVEGGSQIVLSDRRPNRDGTLTLVFGGSPLRLREWTVTDPQGATTRVQLVTLTAASGLADSLFRDPR